MPGNLGGSKVTVHTGCTGAFCHCGRSRSAALLHQGQDPDGSPLRLSCALRDEAVIPSSSPHLPRGTEAELPPFLGAQKNSELWRRASPGFLPLHGPLPLSSGGSSLKLSLVLDLAEGRELQGHTPRVSVLPCCFLALSPGSRSTPASVPLFLCKTVASLPLFEDRRARAPNL